MKHLKYLVFLVAGIFGTYTWCMSPEQKRAASEAAARGEHMKRTFDVESVAKRQYINELMMLEAAGYNDEAAMDIIRSLSPDHSMKAQLLAKMLNGELSATADPLGEKELGQLRELLSKRPSLSARNVSPDVLEAFVIAAPERVLARELINAAEERDTDRLRRLLDFGANVNAADKDGFTALMATSLADNNDQAMQLLLDRGANVDATDDEDGATALGHAVAHDKESLVKLLLDHGVKNVDADRHGSTPLLSAVYNNSEPIVRLLLDHGANVDAADQYGDTALLLAVQARNNLNKEPVVQLLLDHGANVDAANIHGTTALMRAEAIGNERITQLLRSRVPGN